MTTQLLLLAFAIGAAPDDAPVAVTPADAGPAAVDVTERAPVAPVVTPPQQDTEPPLIEDVAAASAHPDTPPIVTVMMSDRQSGVGEAVVVFRASGEVAWQRAPLVGNAEGGASSLFIARLPDGLQRSGFSYYVEATDRAGNGPVTIGSAEDPIVVERAREPTRVRIERAAQAAREQDLVRVHPGFIMLSFGVGIVAAAAASGYAIDIGVSRHKLEGVEDELARTDLSPERRAALGRARQGYEDAVLYDIAISSVLGVVGVAGLVTGTALLVVSNLE